MFERLTYRDKNGKAWANIKKGLSAHETRAFGKIALERLAAYEDSGLPPEEVQKLAKEKARIESATHYVYAIDEEAKEILDLIDAKAEGRLKVLPCKEGTPVFEIKFNQHDGYWIEPAEFKLSMLSAFGKTVFLSRAEAEKAAGGGQNV